VRTTTRPYRSRAPSDLKCMQRFDQRVPLCTDAMSRSLATLAGKMALRNVPDFTPSELLG
jgi:hypothetical protein